MTHIKMSSTRFGLGQCFTVASSSLPSPPSPIAAAKSSKSPSARRSSIMGTGKHKCQKRHENGERASPSPPPQKKKENKRGPFLTVPPRSWELGDKEPAAWRERERKGEKERGGGGGAREGEKQASSVWMEQVRRLCGCRSHHSSMSYFSLCLHFGPRFTFRCAACEHQHPQPWHPSPIERSAGQR